MMFPSLYKIKKFILLPRTLYMRNKEGDLTGFKRAALDLHYYRAPMYRFFDDQGASRLVGGLELNSSHVVLDVGAFTGEWAKKIAKQYGCKVLAFEPNPESFISLTHQSEWCNKIHPYPYGIGDVNVTSKISLQGMGSTLFDGVNQDDGTEWTAVEVRAVDDVWQDLQLDRVDLMKINIEGAEFPLLEKMIERGLLSKVDCYMIQFHEWHPGAYFRRWKIRRELSKTHELDWDYSFVWERWVRR